MKIKRALFLLIMIISVQFSAIAQDEDNSEEFVVAYHSKGDQTFSIEAGLFLPLFRVDPTPGKDGEDSDFIDPVGDQLKLGGSGFLSYCAYLDNNWRLGGEFGGMFAYTLNDNMLYMVPIMVKAVYDINLNTYLAIPLYLSGGITLNTYGDYFSVDPILVPGVGFNWNFSSEWTFGLKYSFWIIPEFASEENQSSIGWHSDIRLGVEYHF